MKPTQSFFTNIADNQLNTVIGVVFAILSLFAFVIAGARLAYFSLDKRDLDILRTKSQPPYRRVIELVSDSQTLFVSLQVATLFMYSAITLLGIYLLTLAFESTPLIHFFVVFLPIVIVILYLAFLEFLPRMLAAQNPVRYAKDFSWVTLAIYYIFGTLGRSMNSVSFSLEKMFFRRKSESYSENSELETAIDTFSNKEASDEEKNILKAVSKFNTITAKQVMTPRLFIQGLEYGLSFNELLDRLGKMKVSRLPIYKENLDNIVGLLYTKDLLPIMHQGADVDWHQFIREPFFIPETKNIDSLLGEFQTSRRRIAVVVDEFGGTGGIVTIEDVQDEIVGKIKDEFDGHQDRFEKISEQEYIFDGMEKLSTVFRIMKVPSDAFVPQRKNADTLAGLVLQLIGVFPNEGDVIKAGQYALTVVLIRNNRLVKIKVAKNTTSQS